MVDTSPDATATAPAPAGHPCPVCADGVLEPFLHLGEVPLVTTELWPTREAALAAPRAELDLACCTSCGMVRNTAFEPELVDYSPSYENSQHFSPAFTAYARDLARHLVERYDLAHGTVVEIGSGKGEFLALLCEEGAASAVGFDPTYDGEVDDRGLDGRLTFVRAYYDEAQADRPADLVCCRHVLEHLEDPVALLTSLRRTIGDRATALYFEVPDADCVLSPKGQWDLIYQHVSYFSPPALRLLFERCGFEVTALRSTFDGQYLALEARPAPVPAAPPAPDAGAGAEASARARSFAGHYRASLARWQELFAADGDEPSSVALWGAGAKGVAFLNATGAGDGVDAVVDVNPRKHGTHTPGTGHRVAAPDELAGARPTTVLIMNPVYEDEIRAQLAAMGLHPRIVAV